MSNDPIGKISFATGGEKETYTIITYVAKDKRENRCKGWIFFFSFLSARRNHLFPADCHVFDCGALADDVLATLGQVFTINTTVSSTKARHAKSCYHIGTDTPAGPQRTRAAWHGCPARSSTRKSFLNEYEYPITFQLPQAILFPAPPASKCVAFTQLPLRSVELWPPPATPVRAPLPPSLPCLQELSRFFVFLLFFMFSHRYAMLLTVYTAVSLCMYITSIFVCLWMIYGASVL